MSSDIVLGTATRQNLLALQGINQNLDTTQGHLATGLKVASALDDAVKFFQAQSLSNRASDLAVRKDAIDQGVSSLTTAVNAAQSEVSILQQLQGILSSAKTQTAAQRAAASKQFDTLGNQLNQLLNDASYQGLNLVNSTAAALSLQFSTSSKSTLKVSGQNLLFSNIVTTKTVASKLATKLVGSAWSKLVSANKTSLFDVGFNAIQNAIAKVQAAAASIGGNVTFLQSRLDFTSQYIVTLQGGASKLTVADVNEESTNLVTLQTRQSLSIQSLSIATQSEQAVLRLFR
ncbi:MAG TPA: flagellin [Candidatus Sulfotelmatobacter sp.]|nr:flagellin [Candidatus Sulfotelmatobacter sp.]